MKEIAAIIEAWEVERAAGREAVLATVVKVEGSAYRRPGARMLVCADGRRFGSVSGGCLEDEVARKGWWRTEAGPSVVTFDARVDRDADPDEREAAPFGMGCDGVVHVLCDRLRPTPGGDAGISVLRASHADGRARVIATVIGGDDPRARVGDRLAIDPDGEVIGAIGDDALTRSIADDARRALAADRSTHRAGPIEIFFEVVRPPRRLVIFGAGHDAIPVVRLAKALGWHVTVADGRSHYATRDRFPDADQLVVIDRARPIDRVAIPRGAACVVMTHSEDQDRALFAALAPLPLGYLGVLGPRRRTDRLLDEIGRPSFACATGLHAPVGLDVGAETPEEIALAIIAEAQARMARRDAGSLRDRADAPIHPIAAS
jgi:xanthine dehydrogenase accessory factor